MISHKYKCIFIHLGRTGGTSTEFALDETVHGVEKHWSQRIMRRKYKLYWKDYYKFTSVRNPYDWMVSQYFHNKQINYDWYEKTYNVDLKTMSFLDYLKFNDPTHAHALTRRYASGDRQTQTRSHDVFKVDVMLDNLNEIDYIIRFEELQKGFDYVCDQIGKPKTLLEKIESSTHESYMNYYDTQEKIDIINEDYREYFETFGYEMVNTI